MAKSKASLLSDNEIMMSKIYYIRGHKVMLDKDLATLYDVKPTRLREQVKRIQSVFPKALCSN